MNNSASRLRGWIGTAGLMLLFAVGASACRDRDILTFSYRQHGGSARRRG